MKRILTGPVLAAAVCTGGFVAAAPSKPNVIVSIADDLGYADLGFLPQAPADVKKYGTPGIDRLAKTGTYFSNAYGASLICSPSRAGLITGRYQQRWGNTYSNNTPLLGYKFAETLRPVGRRNARSV